MKHILVSPFPPVEKSKEKKATHDQDEDLAIDDFNSGSEPKLDIICNMISILPIEYDTTTKENKEEGNGLAEELAKHKPLCYYVIKDVCVDEEKAVFERLDMEMQQHFKPLFIKSKVENVGINKVLVDCVACVNIIPHSMRRNIGKYDTNLKPHNMVFIKL